MNNSELFCTWLEKSHPESAALKLPRDGEFFRFRYHTCALPYLRVYWKDETGESPEWQSETWLKFGQGHTRFLRADQGLEWLASITDNADDGKARLEQAIWRALYRAWLVPVDELGMNCGPIVSRRVQAVRVTRKGNRLFWQRDARFFPDQMRQPVEGVDLVHTPDNEDAGLIRYLCVGWTISDSGELKASSPASKWGPSTVKIPYRLFDAPRRLMLGAGLQMRAVGLTLQSTNANEETIPGCYLRAAFSCFSGWTHEDAIVLSACAAEKLTRHEIRQIQISIPAVASRIEVLVESGSNVSPGQKLVRAFIDLYALGLRHHEATNLGADDGWLEVALLSNEVTVTGSITEIKRTPEDWSTTRTTPPKWRETITFTLERDNPVQVGDKLGTRHGIKGVVSRILEDAAMPSIGNEPAEIILSPIGTARRSAMGQFREANNSDPLPHHGTIFVMRQAQDAEPRCRVRGSEEFSTVRGQRFGEMEFWALMAYDVHHLAKELLSLGRSTSRWLQWERGVDSHGDHRTLATCALNRFLSQLQIKIKQGRFVKATPEAFPIACRSLGDFKDARDLLEDSGRFRDRGGLGAIKLATPVKLTLENKLFTFEQVYLLPPWLRPSIDGRLHPLTKAYLALLYAIFSGRDLRQPIKRCLRMALSDKQGVGGFLRREILGRRLKRSARAVIVPRPDIRIDQVAIPAHVANILFAGLPDKQQSLVLVNRNPTLHKRGLLALRPFIDHSNNHVFGLPPGVLSVLGADFDGDQAAIFAIETEESLVDASRLMPGVGSRIDEFRPESPAFPLLRELSQPQEELMLAHDTNLSQEDWCTEHQRLVNRQLEDIKDGWQIKLLHQILNENSRYLSGLNEVDWFQSAQEEMQKVYAAVRKKGQLGGVIRQQLFKRAYVDDYSFSQSVAAVQAVTERLTQSALSVKGGRGTAEFDAETFFKDPISNQHLLEKLDSKLDSALIATSLAASVNPAGITAWMNKPRLNVLIEAASEASEESQRQETASNSNPRIHWFLD
jgi:hypothetical protein